MKRLSCFSASDDFCRTVGRVFMTAKLGGRFRGPDVRVLDHEPGDVRFQHSHKASSGAFVTIRPIADSSVDLLERLEGKAGKTEPRGSDAGVFSNREIQAPNRKQIR